LKVRSLSALLFTLFLPCYAIGQHASFSGSVEDRAGEPVPNALIILETSEKSFSQKNTTSAADGSFSITNIEAGTYTLIIRSLGFQILREKISFERNESKDIRFTLKSKVYQSEMTVVTASRTQKELEDVSVPVSVVSEQEIKLSGSTRLKDILEEQIGMNIVSDHGNGVQLQGFDPDYTLIMIDNQPVIGRSAGTLDLDRLSVGDVKQIEVVKGPSSALWGSDALAGVINIITEKGSRPFDWDITGRYGAHNSYDGSTNMSFKKEKWSGKFFANTNGSNGYDMDKSTVSPTVPEHKSHTFSGGLHYKATKNVKVGFQSRFYREDLSYLSDIELNNSIERIKGNEYQQNYSVTPEVSVNLGERQLLEASTYLSRFESENRLNFTSNGSIYDLTTYEQVMNKYELKSSTFWNNTHTTILGVGLNHEELVSGNYADAPSFNSFFTFGQHEWQLIDELSLTAGYRFDTHSEYASQFSPKFSTLYKPNDFIHIRASVGGGFKAPEFRQLFLNFTNAQVGYSVFGSSTVVEGIEQLQDEGQIQDILIDPNTVGEIEAEQSFAYNLGLDMFPFDGIQLRINAFRNNVQDLIETQRIAVKNNGQSVYSYFNLNKIYTQGIESELRFTPQSLNDLRIAFGYQFLDARREITRQFDDVVDGRVVTVTEKDYIPMLSRSKHTFNAKFFYTLEELGIESSLRFQFRGKYWFADYNNNNRIDDNEYALKVNPVEQGGPYAFRYMAGILNKTFINASLAKTFFNNYRLQVGVDNLTNYTNNQFLPSNPGTTFYAQLNIQLY